MTDAFVCDRCDAVEKFASRVGEYELPRRVWDIDAREDAVDVTGQGHLCEDCSQDFGQWLNEGDN